MRFLGQGTDPNHRATSQVKPTACTWQGPFQWRAHP